MNTELQSGDKIQYRLFDKKGKEHWLKGVIHGVRRYEDPVTNMIINQTYLVDTGRHERLDEYPFDHRNREINKRMNDIAARKGVHSTQALKEVLKHSDLPESKMDTEVVRQPEQIELPAEHIRRA